MSRNNCVDKKKKKGRKKIKEQQSHFLQTDWVVLHLICLKRNSATTS